MRRSALVLVFLLSLAGIACGTTGQGVVRGTVMDEQGQPLSGCRVDRGLRLGVGCGGFDDVAHGTSRTGEFALPVNRGFNRLTCDGESAVSASTVAWPGRSPRLAIVLD